MSKDKLIPQLRFPEFENGKWNIKTVNDYCNVYRGSAFSKADMIEDGSEHCIHYGELFTKYNEVITEILSRTNKQDGFRSESGDVLMPSSDVTPDGLAKASAITLDGVILGGDMNILRPKTEINSIFLSYLLNNSKREIIKLVSGTTVKHIYPSQIITCEIPVIDNEIEQQKIASCLYSLDELVAAHNEKLNALKDHKKGLMQNLFPQEGETVPKVRFKEFEGDGEWELKELGKVAQIITGNTPSTKEPSFYGGGRMFVSPADINDNRIVSETKTTLTELGFSKTRQIKSNSVLFVCIGSTIGKVAQNKYECATNQQINSLVALKGYSSDFLYSLLDCNSKQIASIAGNHAVPLINKTSFSAVKLPFPPSKEEQHKIASCLSALDELITAQVDKIEQLQQHKKGLMQGLFPKIR